MANNIPKVPNRLALPKTLPKDLPAVIEWLKQMTEELQHQTSLTSTFLQSAQNADVLANRAASASPGATFWATDALHFYVYNGTSWVTVI